METRKTATTSGSSELIFDGCHVSHWREQVRRIVGKRSTCELLLTKHKALAMDVQSADELNTKKCVPCEGGVDPCPLPFITSQLEKLPGWYLTNENQRIRKDWTLKNFVEGLAFFEAVGKIAEKEAHHPDLHLESYRNVSIEIWTHAIGGLSENDFILAAKIDAIEM